MSDVPDFSYIWISVGPDGILSVSYLTMEFSRLRTEIMNKHALLNLDRKPRFPFQQVLAIRFLWETVFLFVCLLIYLKIAKNTLTSTLNKTKGKRHRTRNTRRICFWRVMRTFCECVRELGSSLDLVRVLTVWRELERSDQSHSPSKHLIFTWWNLKAFVSHYSCSHPTSWRTREHKGSNVLAHRKSRSMLFRTSVLSPKPHTYHTVRYDKKLPTQFFMREDEPTKYVMYTSSGQLIQFNQTNILWAL